MESILAWNARTNNDNSSHNGNILGDKIMTICKKHPKYMAIEPPKTGCLDCQKMYNEADALEKQEQEYNNCYALKEAIEIYERCLNSGFQQFENGHKLKSEARAYLQKCAAKFQDEASDEPGARDELG